MSTNFCLPFHETPATQRLSAAMQRAKEKADEAMAVAAEKQATTPVKMLLPGLNESVRAIPNYIARSAIFAPVRKGCRQIHDETVFLEGPNILLKGSGKQLSEDHSDIWMHAMYLQTTVLVGEAPVINRADFLRGMGRNTSGASYQWLHDGMKDLSRFTICIEARRRDGSVKYSYGKARSCRLLAMIGGFDYQESTGLYTLYADPRWAQIFGNREFALLDWAKRLRLRHDLSKSLQRLIGTSADERQKFALQTLKDRAQSIGRMRDFRANLERSLAELEACGILARPSIETGARGQEMASWTRL